MTISEDKLLPCPFCGGTKATMFEPTCRPETPYNPADRLFPIVRCMSCYCEVAGKNEDYRGASAIAAWNRRAPSTELTVAMEALRPFARLEVPEKLRNGGNAGAYSILFDYIRAARAALELREKNAPPREAS